MLTLYAKQRILQLHWAGNAAPAIEKLLKEGEGIIISRVKVWKFLRNYSQSGCILRKQGMYIRIPCRESSGMIVL